MLKSTVRIQGNRAHVPRAAKANGLRRPLAPAARPRNSSLDTVRDVIRASRDLREADGNLSAERIAALYGLSLSELGAILNRSRQALWKAPAAASLQNGLGFLERIARLRLALENERDFLVWLKASNPGLGGETPLEWLRARRWQELADLVEDILTGNPA